MKSKNRGTDYGVGTFIKEFTSGLSSKQNVKVFILEIGITSSKPSCSTQQNGITIIKIPIPPKTKETGPKSIQEKLARNISRIVSQLIPKENVNVIHMNYVFQYFIATDLKKALNAKLIFTQHLFIMGQKAEGSYFDMEFQTYESADRIITVTQHGKEHLIEKGVDAKKIKCIYNGIDPAHFNKTIKEDIKKKYGLPQQDKLILYSGRIDSIKGLDYLCQATVRLVKKMPDCRLVIAGDGDFKTLIESARKISANISFLGFIPFEDVVALYQQADIGVIPSLEEHCSYVALEMLHCGLPVVASKLGGLKEIFIHDENAFLADTIIDNKNMYGIAPDVEKLEKQLFTLLSDESKRNIFTENALKRASNMFTSNTMVNHYLQTLNTLN